MATMPCWRGVEFRISEPCDEILSYVLRYILLTGSLIGSLTVHLCSSASSDLHNPIWDVDKVLTALKFV